METRKMTIHRALAELKLLDSRIDNAISAFEPIGLMREGKLVSGLFEKKDFEACAKSKFDSVNSLIVLKESIKSAIVKANASTNVTIAGKEMTIAEAINHKTLIDKKRSLINRLSSKYNAVHALFIQENEKVEQVALENAKIMIGKQGDDRVKATDEDVKAIVEPYVKRNKIHLIDPLDSVKLIESLKEEVDLFEAEVDACLSEINAITVIEV